MPAPHNHDCFATIADTFRKFEADDDGRTGYFLYVGNDANDDSHFLGNTAFAGGVFLRLVRDVTEAHESNGCAQCDRVALALHAARRAFHIAMQGAPGNC